MNGIKPATVAVAKPTPTAGAISTAADAISNPACPTALATKSVPVCKGLEYLVIMPLSSSTLV